MDRAQKRLRTEEGAGEPPPDVNFVVTAQGGDGTIHVLQENLGEEQIIHNNGECQVYMNTKDQCTYILKELDANGLSAKIIK